MGLSTFWRGRPVLVTGGTGLIGSWLIKQLLAAEANVVVLVKDYDPQSELLRSGDICRVSVVNGGLEDYACVESAINRHEIDTVFHLGAQTIVSVANRSPLQTFEANIRGTYNLLEACRVHRSLVTRVMVASSDKAYGDQPVLPYTEDMRLDGIHPYDASKTCTDVLAKTYHHTYGLPITITRCGNVYGGGDLNWSRIVPGTIRSLLNGQRPILRSDGTYLRDYIYVKDACNAYLQLAEALDRPEIKGQAFNVSPETPVSVLAIVDQIRAAMDCMHLQPDIRNTAHAEIRDQYLSAGKVQALIGWRPEYDLRRGLTETISWYTRFCRESEKQLATSVAV